MRQSRESTSQTRASFRESPLHGAAYLETNFSNFVGDWLLKLAPPPRTVGLRSAT